MKITMLAGFIGATVTVFVTTLNDALWLIPFVGSSSSPWSERARFLHGAAYMLTFQALAITSVLIALAVIAGALEWDDGDGDGSQTKEQAELVLGAIGASLCWMFALGFYIKKVLKRRRRQQVAINGVNDDNDNEGQERIELTITEEDNENYEEMSERETEGAGNGDDNAQEGHAVGTVMSLTFLGALDEMSYFPALVIGGIFNPIELCLGTFLATVLILIVVTYFLGQCKPLTDCLDRIPTYAIISLYATILTAGVIYDALDDD